MLLVNKDLQTVKGHGYRRAGAHHVGRTRRLHCVYIQAGYYCINVYCLTQTIYSVNDALCYGAHSILVIMTSSHHWAVFSFAFCPSVRPSVCCASIPALDTSVGRELIQNFKFQLCELNSLALPFRHRQLRTSLSL